MKRVFADTFYYVALFGHRDSAHRRTDKLIRSLRLNNIVTTTWVLTEFANTFGGTDCRVKCGMFIDGLYQQMDVEIVPPTDALFKRGLQLYNDRPDKEWSLTDCISFIVMKERRIKEALRGDHHFEQAGFIALLK